MNPIDKQNEVLICQSHCHHCQTRVAWKINRLAGIGTQICCILCDNPVDIDSRDIAGIEPNRPVSNRPANNDFIEQAMQLQMRQQAFASTAKMNWLEAGR